MKRRGLKTDLFGTPVRLELKRILMDRLLGENGTITVVSGNVVPMETCAKKIEVVSFINIKTFYCLLAEQAADHVENEPEALRRIEVSRREDTMAMNKNSRRKPSRLLLVFVCTVTAFTHGIVLSHNLNADAAATTRIERSVPLSGQSNFRDLGGYKTVDGRIVKKGVLYRSGEMQNLTDADLEVLKSLGIRTVLNFLTPEEIERRGRDRLPAGVREVPQPIVGGVAGDLTKAVSKARENGDFSGLPVEINPEIHRLLIDAGAEQYAALVREIGNGANLPLAFHCSHGIHRTGTASALVLSLLGVPWETVREDYLLSNTTRKAEVRKRLSELRDLAAKNQGVKPEQVDTTNMEAFYILDGSYIDASLDEIIKRFGSIENYARKGLRLTDEDLDRLRNALLE